MDGNGRWARRRGLPRTAGHLEGVKRAREIVRACGEKGIGVLTLYAFSTENWRRPAEEVGFLMRLFEESLEGEIEGLCQNNVVLRIIGRVEELPESVRQAARRGEEATAGNSGLVLNVALNYGGRAELVDAARRLARQVQAGELTPEAIDEAAFAGQLYTAGLPDPDLVIRPSGEQRLSNFLLWQAAYAELYLTPTLWPDFTREEFERALAAYSGRRRRFGAL
ncbi:MAG TPA: di-trans,poly-cis-decaprenylcistransferase [Firmicutes bacterium]|nr:di-trans,poly-cis-decaprenylcistransferase [Bacillota bacterium]